MYLNILKINKYKIRVIFLIKNSSILQSNLQFVKLFFNYAHKK